MKTDEVARPRPWRRRWTDPEKAALIRWRLLEFIPVEDHADLAKRFPDHSDRIPRSYPDSRRQRECYANWVDVGTDLWSDPRWRGCLLMRYSRGDVPAISHLPADWRERLDAAANGFRSSEVKSEQPASEPLWDVVRQTTPLELLNDAYINLAYEYLEARVTEQWSDSHPLCRPLSESGLFRRAFERADADLPDVACQYANADLTDAARQHGNRSLGLIGIRAGHPLELVGQVTYYLILLDDWGTSKDRLPLPEPLRAVWPESFSADIMRPSEDFSYIAGRYSQELEIPRQSLNEILAAFITESMKHFFAARHPAQHAVFWAAKILHTIQADVFEEYLKWVGLFRKKVLPRLVEWTGEQPTAPMKWAIIDPWQQALWSNPLLNCVFHSEVFDGEERLQLMHQPGRPPRSVEGITIAYAVEKLQPVWKRRRNLTPKQILTDRGRLSMQVRNSLDAANDTSRYSYLAPLITAMIPQCDWFYSPAQIREAWRLYRSHSELPLLRDNLARQFSSAIRG